jgi:hypothetical protein
MRAEQIAPHKYLIVFAPGARLIEALPMEIHLPSPPLIGLLLPWLHGLPMFLVSQTDRLFRLMCSEARAHIDALRGWAQWLSADLAQIHMHTSIYLYGKTENNEKRTS